MPATKRRPPNGRMPQTVHVRPMCNGGPIRRRDLLIDALRQYKWMTYFQPLDGGKIIRLGDLGGNREPPLFRVTCHFPDGHIVQVYKDTDGNMFVTKLLQ